MVIKQRWLASLGHCLCLCIGSLSAAEFYVAPDGKDDASNSANSPWPLAKANAEAQAGDTVVLADGSYTAPIAPAHSGTAGKPIIYKAAANAHPTFSKMETAVDLTKGQSYITIDSITAINTARWIVATGGGHLTVAGCKFDMTETSKSFESCRLKKMGDGLVFRNNSFRNGTDSLAIQGGSNDLIEGNSFDTAGHTCLVLMGVQRSVVRKNTLTNPKQKLMEVLTTRKRDWEGEARKSQFMVIEENHFDFTTGNYGYSGIQFAGNQCVVRRNVFHHCAAGLDIAGWGVLKPGKPENPDRPEGLFDWHNRFCHNVVFECGDKALSRGAAVIFETNHPDFGDEVLKNNIIFHNACGIGGAAPGAQIIFAWDCTPSHARLFNNLIMGEKPGQEAVFWDDAKEAKPPLSQNSTLKDFQQRYPDFAGNNIEADPEFVDAAHDDFQLKAGSPCIESGAPLTQAKTAGKGDELDVEDALYFTDGFGIVGGDAIRVGNEHVKIKKVDFDANRITLATPIEWSAGAPVSLDYSGKAPNIGSYEGPGK